jgi:hypothetical protein
VSDTLTRPHDFRSSILPPAIRSVDSEARANVLSPMHGIFAVAAMNLAVMNTKPDVPVMRVSELTIPNLESQTGYHTSPAAFTRKSLELKVDGFLCALRDAVKFSEAMVAEDEGAPLNIQTWAYASQTLVPLITALDLDSPLLLPLQNGGIGAEWHDFGLNIELRFRNPYQVYVVIEDARGIISPFHDFDSNLLQLNVALRELAARKPV